MLTENLEYLANLDTKLKQIDEADEKGIDVLYLRVFNTPNGELVLRDLANRCYANDTTALGGVEYNQTREGMRMAYLNIITRLHNAVTGKKKEVEDV